MARYPQRPLGAMRLLRLSRSLARLSLMHLRAAFALRANLSSASAVMVCDVSRQRIQEIHTQWRPGWLCHEPYRLGRC